MARIRTYDLDTTISDQDYLLGNDGNNGSVVTKRFSLEDLKEFIVSGTDIDIIREVPARHLMVVNQNGDDIQRAPIQVSYTPIDEEIVLVNPEAVLGVETNYYVDGNGNPFIQFKDYNLEYFLPGFVGTQWTFTTSLGGGDTEYVGTISSYDGFVNQDGVVVDTFSLSITDTPYQTPNSVLELTVTGANSDGNFGILSQMEMSSLVITGGIDVNGDLNIGSNDDRSIINVHGFLQFDDQNEGIRFGDEDANVFVTTDGMGNIVTTGEGVINVENQINLNGGVSVDELILSDEDSTTTLNSDGITVVENGVTKQLQSVSANSPQSSAVAELTSVQIDGQNFVLPALTSAVAEVLPGLDESLSGPSETIVTGRFFFGTQSGSTITFTSASTDILTLGLTVAEGATSVELGVITTPTVTPTAAQTVFTYTGLTTLISATINDVDRTSDFTAAPGTLTYSGTPDLATTDSIVFKYTTAATDVDILAFETWWALRDVAAGEIGFFVEDVASATSGIDAATNGDMFTVPYIVGGQPNEIFMIVGYNDPFNIIGLGQLGTGAINITADVLNLSPNTVIATNLPEEDEAVFDFVTIGDDNILSRKELDIQGTANGARYTFGMNEDLSISNITFEGDHNISLGGAGELVLDISGRYTEGGVFTVGGPTNLFSLNVLDTIGADQVMMLPQATTFGDSVKFVNVSTLAADGTEATSSQWSITPVAGQNIMKQAVGQALVLDDPTASFEMTWVGGTVGWVVIGIN